MKKLLIIMSIIIAGGFSFGQTIVNPGDGTLTLAITNAADGDVLQLIPGSEYTESTNTSFGTLHAKRLTIEVPDAETSGMAIVKISTSDPGQFFSMTDSSSLTLDGIEFDGSQSNLSAVAHLIQLSVTDNPVESHAGTVRIQNCLIHNLTDYIIGGGNSNLAGLFILDSTFIENTIIRNTGTTIYFKYNGANYIEMKNTTVYDLDGKSGYGMRIAGVGSSGFTDESPVALIDHTTWYNIAASDAREVLLLEQNPNPDNRWTITNSIFQKENWGTNKVFINLKNLNDSVAHVSNIAYWDVGIRNWRNFEMGDTLYIDPGFKDPDNGDFTIPDGSPLLNFGTDGKAIGDPRWTKNSVGVEDKKNFPVQYSLAQNYPNPFNPSTKINYSLKHDGNVTIKIYNILGKEVATIVNEHQSAGEHTVNFKANNLNSGIYFYTINSDGFRATKKMILLK